MAKVCRFCDTPWGANTDHTSITSRRLTGNIPALTDLYQHEVLFDAPNEKEYLLGKRILTRITPPSELLDGNLVNAVE